MEKPTNGLSEKAGEGRRDSSDVTQRPASVRDDTENLKKTWTADGAADDALRFVMERGVAHLTVSEEESKRICRKADLTLMPLVCVALSNCPQAYNRIPDLG